MEKLQLHLYFYPLPCKIWYVSHLPQLKSGTVPIFPAALSRRVLPVVCWETRIIWQCGYFAKTVWYEDEKEAHSAPFGAWMQFRVSLGEARSLPCSSAFSVMLCKLNCKVAGFILVNLRAASRAFCRLVMVISLSFYYLVFLSVNIIDRFPKYQV